MSQTFSEGGQFPHTGSECHSECGFGFVSTGGTFSTGWTKGFLAASALLMKALAASGAPKRDLRNEERFIEGQA